MLADCRHRRAFAAAAAALLLIVAFASTSFAHVDFTDSQRKDVVDASNKLRSTVALGNALNKNGTALPSSAKMNSLGVSESGGDKQNVYRLKRANWLVYDRQTTLSAF